MSKNSGCRYEKINSNIYRIVLPLPGEKPGPVNVYLFLGKEVTLFDAGTVNTVKLLKEIFKEIGIGISDIKRIILSHGHADHYGGANKIVKEARGKIIVAGHKGDKNLIESGNEISGKQYIEYFRLMDIPFLFQLSIFFARRFYSSLADNAHIDEYLSDGERLIAGDYEAEIIGVPGHSKGSINLFLGKEKILFSGDHVLGHITPNAFVMLEPDTPMPSRLSQLEFYDSLRKIEALSPRVVYPAHGEPVHDLSKTTGMYREQFSKRQKKILSILKGGPYTVYQIARRLFPGIKGLRLAMEIYLAVSEVFTHLQVLEKEKKAALDIKEGRLYAGLR